MFGLSNLQIYGIQPTSNNNNSNETTNGIKMTANFLEKLIRNELLLGNSSSNHSNNNCNNNNNHNGVATGSDPSKNHQQQQQKLTTMNGKMTNREGREGGENYHIISVDDKENNNNNYNKFDNGASKEMTTKETFSSKQIKQFESITTIATKGGGGGGGNENEIDRVANHKNSDGRNSNEMVDELSNGIQNETKNSLDVQRKKFMQMITFLDQQNQRLERELAKEKRRRGEELSKIIKSLLCFEAKLKHDKKVINHKLYERDNEICRLINLNRVLKKKYGAMNDDENEMIHDSLLSEEIQFCPNCRKGFYGVEQNNSGTQTFAEESSLKDDQTEHGSSSDETVSSSFYGARRSVRYTSKRTFGTFRDYMRSRCMMVDDSNLDNSEENTSTLSRDESQYSCYEKANVAYSKTIDRLHGVKRVESFEADSESEIQTRNNYYRAVVVNDKNSSHCDDDEEVFLPAEKLSKNKKCSAKEFAEISPKQEFETSTDDWYASASDAEENDDVRAKPYTYNAVNPVLECVNQILLQQSMEECLNDGPPSLESNENNSGSGGSSSNKEGTVTRKRVHFSTKNSMVHVPRDDISSPIDELENSSNQKDNSFNYESIYSNEYEPIGSEHNSSNLYVDMESKLGQDDRAIVPIEKPKPPALPPKPANLMKIRRVLRVPLQPCPIRKIEPKIDEKTESEPDYCSISEVNEAITSVQIVVDVHKPPDDDQSDTLSQKTDEIEEIFADIPKLPNVAAIMAPKAISKFINNDNYITKSSPTKDDSQTTAISNRSTEHTLVHHHKSPSTTHIPKILADINKKISTSTPTTALPSSSSTVSASISGITSKPPFSPSKATIPSSSTPLSSSSPACITSSSTPSASIKVISATAEDKLPLQAEFDWYNLDAEYGKSNQPDVIKATDINAIVNNGPLSSERHHHRSIDGLNMMNGLNENNCIALNGQIAHSVEYNLDEEFSLANQPDIIRENVVDTKICMTPAASTVLTHSAPASPKPTVCEKFPTIVDQTPCARRIKLRTDFTNFIENSGLSTKPLPRQRKIYFSGPFV